MSGKALRDLNASSLLERKNDSANKGDIGPEAVYSEIEYIENENLKDVEDTDTNLIVFFSLSLSSLPSFNIHSFGLCTSMCVSFWNVNYVLSYIIE